MVPQNITEIKRDNIFTGKSIKSKEKKIEKSIDWFREEKEKVSKILREVKEINS